MSPNSVFQLVMQAYSTHCTGIVEKLRKFKRTWKLGNELDLFAELVFCLLTPQSKAKVCWRAVEELRATGLLRKGNAPQIASALRGVRFARNKARYVLRARRQFLGRRGVSLREVVGQHRSAFPAREWLARNVLGLGYKEASHFLRNIGRGDELAILDRHILKNLKLLRVIPEVPAVLTRARYLRIEKALKDFAKSVNIPPSYLDLVLWCKETGEVFK